MIYCEKENGNYVDQNEKCLTCIFYDKETDSCNYEEWNPGLIQKKLYRSKCEQILSNWIRKQLNKFRK